MTIRQNLEIRQGSTWTHTHVARDSSGSARDLTGYTARASVKSDWSALNHFYFETDAGSADGLITIGGANGEVVFSMTAAQSAQLDGIKSFLTKHPNTRTIEYRYDLELINSSEEVERELEGKFIVHREITSAEGS